MTTKDLKSVILQKAVQGKLVPQIASDGNARDLLEDIRKEKAKLIKAGKLKKEKPLPEITEEEIPFDIPDSWCWCRLGELGTWQAGCTPDRSRRDYYSSNDVPWVLSGDLDDGVVDGSLHYISRIAFDEKKMRLNKAGSVCIAMYGATVGKLGILKMDATTNQAVCVCNSLIGVEPMYLFYFLRNHRSEYVNLSFGGAQPNISKEKIESTLFPLPPLAEQKRIVSAVDSIFEQIDIIEKNQLDLKTYIKQAKSKVLDLAIRGKLVPQDSNDESASVLLDKIKTERVELVRQGKVKKEKPLPEIADDEMPFDIPDSWCWCRLGGYLDIRDGTHDSPKFHDKGVPFVTSKDINGGMLDFSTCKYIAEEDHKKFSIRSFVEDGDILFAMIGSIGNPVIVKKEFDFSFKNMALFKRYSKERTDMKYIFYYLGYIQSKLKKTATGGVQSFVGLQTFREMVFPLPPLAEQKRIVAKVEQVFEQLDIIEKAVE